MQTIEHWLSRNIPVHFKTQKSYNTPSKMILLKMATTKKS